MALTSGAAAIPAAAMTPSHTPRTHHVAAQAPVEKPAPKSGAGRAGAGKSVTNKPGIAKKSEAKPSTTSKPKAGTHGKAHKRHQQESDDPDPVLMYRAGKREGRGAERTTGKASSREANREVAVNAGGRNTRREEARGTHASNVAVAKVELKRAQVGTAAAVQQHPTVTVQDFLVAAGEAPVDKLAAVENKPPPVRGSAKPHATANEPAAMTAVRHDVMRAADAASAPIVRSAAQRPMQAQRVDGFGAEGAMLPPAESEEASVAPMTKPSASKAAPEDAEIAALAQKLAKPVTHEELAEEAALPKVTPMYTRGGKLIVPAPLKGSHEVLVHQNTMADAEGLDRIQDDDDLNRLRARKQLIDFPESASLRLNPELPENRRCARVWSVKFAADMARAFYARFHQPLQVNSAARTVSYQVRLQRVNGNAAAVDGEGASPHLTGQAIDFGKRGMSVAEIAWMRTYLLPLMQAGKVDVEEEFQQACFHISVYRSYMPSSKRLSKTEVATVEKILPKD